MFGLSGLERIRKLWLGIELPFQDVRNSLLGFHED